MIQFLDFLFVLLVIYLVTQIFLPMIFPSELQTNWLFKKKKPSEDKIGDVNAAKRTYYEIKDEVITEAKTKKNEANDLLNSTK